MVALLGLWLLSEVSMGGSGHVVFTRALVGGSPLVPLVAGAGPYRALGHSHGPGRGVWSCREAGVHIEKSSHHFTPSSFHNPFLHCQDFWKQPAMSTLLCKEEIRIRSRRVGWKM